MRWDVAKLWLRLESAYVMFLPADQAAELYNFWLRFHRIWVHIVVQNEGRGLLCEPLKWLLPGL